MEIAEKRETLFAKVVLLHEKKYLESCDKNIVANKERKVKRGKIYANDLNAFVFHGVCIHRGTCTDLSLGQAAPGEKKIKKALEGRKGVLYMARKKKESKKYKPLDEFRYNRSPLAEGHLHYVFGAKGKKYKSLGFTHSQDSTAKKIEVDNPDPLDKRPSFLQLRVHTAKQSYYSDKIKGVRLTKETRGIVRHRIKQYKKSTNRKPPMWYEKKKKKNKKK